MRYLVLMLCLTLPALALEEPVPLSEMPSAHLTGTITKVQAVKGQGMPYLEVEANGETTRVHLGSMRYLLQQNFSPAAGEAVEVDGFQRDDEIVARKVKLVDQDKTIVLRTDEGRPLWQRGRYGQPNERGRGRMKPEGK